MRNIYKIALILGLLIVGQLALSVSAYAADDDVYDVITDLREDTNKAVKDLKTQLDSIKSDNNDAKVSGEFRFTYQNPQRNSTAYNGFDVSRGYITLKKKLAADGTSFRMTLDVGRVSATAGSAQLYDYLKYAYLDLPLGVPAGIPLTATAKLGLQHNMWIDWADKVWDNAYIMKQFADNEGIMSSADFGLGLAGTFSLPILPDMEYHATLFNGPGYKSSESNNAKDLSLRLNWTMMSNEALGTVIAGVYTNIKEGLDTTTIVSQNSTQAGAIIALKNEQNGTIYAELLTGANTARNGISGLSIGGFYNTPLGFGLIGRVDNYDPDSTISDNEKKKTLWGVFIKCSPSVKLAWDVQTSQPGSNGAITQVAYMHAVAAF
ncbi:MAG: hypothetical protein WC838_08065 [Candidatus Margulisiibacteriota bacterium]|jgi:hypothetical protein